MFNIVKKAFLILGLLLSGCGFYPESNYYTESRGDAVRYKLRDPEFGNWKLNSSLLNNSDIYIRVRHLEIDNAGSRLSINVSNDNPSKYNIRPETFSVEVVDSNGNTIHGKRYNAAYFGEISRAPEEIYSGYFDTHPAKQYWWFSIRYPRNTPDTLTEKIIINYEVDDQPTTLSYSFPVTKRTVYRFSWLLYGGGV